MVRGPWRVVRATLLALGVLAAMSTSASVTPSETTTAVAAKPRTVTVLTWNVCGGNNTRCRFYHEPGALVATVRELMLQRGTPTDAAILQEYCSSFVRPLELELETHSGRGWDVRFVPIKVKRGEDPRRAPDVRCNRNRGSYGIVLAVPDENTWWDSRYLPSAEGQEWRVAACATVESWRLKLCNTHFSYGGDDPKGAFRARQVPAYLEFVTAGADGYRVIFGGDLNLGPTSPQLTPAYAAFVECNQVDRSAPRAGPGTSYATRPYDNAKSAKIDYLFTDPDLVHHCAMPDQVLDSSDHRPMWMAVRLPPVTDRARVTG